MAPPNLFGVEGEEEYDGVIVLLVYTVYLFPFQDTSIWEDGLLGAIPSVPFVSKILGSRTKPYKIYGMCHPDTVITMR